MNNNPIIYACFKTIFVQCLAFAVSCLMNCMFEIHAQSTSHFYVVITKSENYYFSGSNDELDADTCDASHQSDSGQNPEMCDTVQRPYVFSEAADTKHQLEAVSAKLSASFKRIPLPVLEKESQATPISFDSVDSEFQDEPLVFDKSIMSAIAVKNSCKKIILGLKRDGGNEKKKYKNILGIEYESSSDEG